MESLYFTFIVCLSWHIVGESINIQKNYSWSCNSVVHKYTRYIHKALGLSSNSLKNSKIDFRSQMKYQQAIYVCFSLTVSWNGMCVYDLFCLHLNAPHVCSVCMCLCMCVCELFCLHVHAPHVCSAHEARRECWIPWDGITDSCDLQFYSLGANTGSRRLASYLNHWAITPVPPPQSFLVVEKCMLKVYKIWIYTLRNNFKVISYLTNIEINRTLVSETFLIPFQSQTL